eukprot:m.58422 g.58422  ORF g.58422 m.58422 type:complete len:406 (-) comp6900_c0_seq3:92-1309(-)
MAAAASALEELLAQTRAQDLTHFMAVYGGEWVVAALTAEMMVLYHMFVMGRRTRGRVCLHRNMRYLHLSDQRSSHTKRVPESPFNWDSFIAHAGAGPLSSALELPPAAGNSGSSGSSTASDGTVLYHFHYASQNSLRKTQAATSFRCVWCSVPCCDTLALLLHLNHSHPRAKYTLKAGECAQIDVFANDQLDKDKGVLVSDSSPATREFQVAKAREFHYWHPRPHDWFATLKEKLSSGGSVDVTRLLVVRRAEKKRVFYSSKTFQPLVSIDSDHDTDDDCDLEWLHSDSNRLIDEFTDLNNGEKAIMKLWNMFLARDWPSDCLTDRGMPAVCRAFILRRAPDIARARLRNNLALHLANMRDFGLLSEAALLDLLALYERVCAPGETISVEDFEFRADTFRGGTLL